MSIDESTQPPDPSQASTAVPRVLDGEVLPKLRLQEAAEEQPAPTWPSFRLRLSTALAAGLGLLALGSATLAGVYTLSGHQPKADPTALALNRIQNDMDRLKLGVDTLHPAADLARQDEAVRSLKRSVDGLKAELDNLRTNNSSALAQLATKLDKGDPAPKIADVMARIDKLDHDPAPKLAEITARLDRIEKQVSSPSATGSISTPAKPIIAPPLQVQAIAVPPQLPKPATLGNWIVRDVYDGIALVEGRAGGVREVTPGEFLPGAGEVRSIERRGRAWIVVTSRGIIDNATW